MFSTFYFRKKLDRHTKIEFKLNMEKNPKNSVLGKQVPKIYDTGCSIWKVTKVNLYCGYVFRVTNLSLWIFVTTIGTFCFLEKNSDNFNFGFWPYF